MKIRDIMRVPVCIVETTTLAEVVDLLAQNELSGFPVVDENGLLSGFVTEHDLIKAVLPTYDDIITTEARDMDSGIMEGRAFAVRNDPVSTIMSINVTTVSVDDPLLKAATTVILKKMKVLPVVVDGKPVGVVSRLDIAKAVMHGERSD